MWRKSSGMVWFVSAALIFEFVGYVQCSIPITEYEYSQLPAVFELDDFDKCMLLEKKALYCAVTFQVSPINPNKTSKTWQDIQKLIAQPKNYRHDWLRRGICVPLTCGNFTDTQVMDWRNENVTKPLLENCYTDKLAEYGLQGVITKIHCENDQPFYDIDEYDMIVGICLMTLLFIIVLASIYEGNARYKPKEVYDKMFSTTCGKLIACFSLPKNWYRLTTVNSSPDAKALSGIQGIRFLNMVMVILGHACMVAFFMPISNTIYVEESTQRFLNMLIVNGGVVVQSFLMISGLLLSYHFFLTMESRKEVNPGFIWLAFFNRYIRLTPCVVVMIALSGTWINHLGRGPLWDQVVGEEYRNCRENWWTNLLYVNNYVNKEHMCMQQTWYLATDTQLFVVALFIVMAIWKYKNYVKYILGVTFTISILIPFTINYIYSYEMVVLQYPENLQTIFLPVEHWHAMYTAGYNNIGSYIIGIALGYAFYQLRGDDKYSKSKTYTVLWWILVWGLPLTVIFIGGIAYTENYTYNRFWASVYAAISRSIFGLGIGLIVLGTSLNIGWYMRWLLQWQGFQILGRLTYCTYLVHVFFVRIRGGYLRQPEFVADYLFIAQTLGDVIIGYVGALGLCLFVELPVSALQKLLVPQLANRRHQNLTEKSKLRVEEDNKLPQEDNQMSRV